MKEFEAVAKAQEILNDLSLADKTTNLKNTKVERLLVANRPHPELVEEGKKFDVYQISFEIIFSDYKLVYESGEDYLINVWVDKKGELRKLSASTQSYRISDSSTYKIKDLNQIKRGLERGLGTVIKIEEGFPTRVESTNSRAIPIYMALSS